MKKPNFFIIGAPKCGTTSLATWLAEHPAVYMSPVKEPHHYCSDFAINYGYNNRNDYLSLFEKANENHLAVGEASVWYLNSEMAVPNILAELPNAKFIVMLRNPVKMAPSLHEQLLFSGNETNKLFDESWGLQDKRRRGQNIPRGCDEQKFILYEDACKLGEMIQRLYTHVLKENVKAIFLEDIIADPRKVWLDVLSFIGVTDDGRAEFPVYNSAKVRRSFFLKRINDMYLNFRQRFNLRPLGTGIFKYIDKQNIREQKRVPLSPMMHKELVDFFKKDIKLLGELLNRDLDHWLL